MHACVKSTPMSLYTYLMSLNKYGCHIANMTHTAITVLGHMDPKFLHMYAKPHPTTISTSDVTAMYRPAKISL